MLSPVRLSVCRLSSVTLVHPAQWVEIFGNISTPFGILPSVDIHGKIYGDRPREPLHRGLNARGVAKCNDFRPIECYISKMVQHRRLVSINH